MLPVPPNSGEVLSTFPVPHSSALGYLPALTEATRKYCRSVRVQLGRDPASTPPTTMGLPCFMRDVKVTHKAYERSKETPAHSTHSPREQNKTIPLPALQFFTPDTNRRTKSYLPSLFSKVIEAPLFRGNFLLLHFKKR